MHRDIRHELQAGRIGRDQAAFDLWRQEFNTERPHEALGMRLPAEVYQPSSRPFHGTRKTSTTAPWIPVASIAAPAPSASSASSCSSRRLSAAGASVWLPPIMTSLTSTSPPSHRTDQPQNRQLPSRPIGRLESSPFPPQCVTSKPIRCYLCSEPDVLPMF